jgi:UDP-N-acetylglucosamine pyrophosphorylase
MAPRAIRAAAFAAAVAGSQAMTVTQVPSGLRLRGGIDIGKVAQNIAGVFNKGPGDSMTSGSVHTGGLRGGGADFAEIRKLMEGENLSESAIGAFQQAYEQLVSGKDGMISEKDISPAADVPVMADIKSDAVSDIKAKELLDKTVVLKLNGGLGTGMGLEKAKSLLKVKGEDTFLDFIAQQVISFRKHKGNVRSMFMNSFSTSDDTKEALKAHPALVGEGWEVVQNKVPKIDASTMKPAKWPDNAAKEWCPPGHGDLYPALAGTGTLDQLLKDGVKYMFVSNSDNLGATLDIDLLSYFAESDMPFIMEVCTRTEADKKGGHLAVRTADQQLLLRESAQCAEEDESEFQNTDKHKYFNTNNLWIRLDKLKEVLDANGGVVPLPMIKNSKTVDPGDANSPKVFQLETAMGAAIESFKGAGAVVVDRSRFAPVKTCADLLRVRSDAYEVTDDYRLVLSADCDGKPPVVDLDSKIYKKVAGLDKMLSQGGLPSLKHCTKLSVKGKVIFEPGITFKGSVSVVNKEDDWKVLKAGTYEDQEIAM